MTIREVIKKIQRHPAVRSSIPLEAQMGFPAAMMHAGKLCLHFLYYNIKVSGEKVLLYEPRYSLRTVYPFNRIVRLEDLFYNPKYTGRDFLSPVSSIELTSDTAIFQRQKTDELFILGDSLLEHCEKQEPIPQEELQAYRHQLYLTVNSAHLQIYKEETE